MRTQFLLSPTRWRTATVNDEQTMVNMIESFKGGYSAPDVEVIAACLMHTILEDSYFNGMETSGEADEIGW